MSDVVDLRDLSGQSLPFTRDLHTYTSEAELLFDHDVDYSIDYNPIEEAVELLESSPNYGSGQTVAEVITEDADELVGLYESLIRPAMAAMVVDSHDLDPIHRDWIQDRLEDLEDLALQLEQRYYPG